MSEARLTKHNRKPKSKKGKNNSWNTVMIPQDKHRAWHCLFGTEDPVEICRIINSTYLDPDYTFVCIKKP